MLGVGSNLFGCQGARVECLIETYAQTAAHDVNLAHLQRAGLAGARRLAIQHRGDIVKADWHEAAGSI